MLYNTWAAKNAGVAELADARDLKSRGNSTPVPVRPRSPAPKLFLNLILYRGVEQLVARRAHNPEVVRFKSHPRNQKRKALRKKCFSVLVAMKRTLRCMKNEVAFGYEACLRHIKKEAVRFASWRHSRRFILAKPMLHFSLKKLTICVILCLESRCCYAER